MFDVEAEIRALLFEQLGLAHDAIATITATTPLLGRGLGIDSIEAMTLATALERRLGITIADSELTLETFTNIQSLQRLIESKLSLPTLRS